MYFFYKNKVQGLLWFFILAKGLGINSLFFILGVVNFLDHKIHGFIQILYYIIYKYKKKKITDKMINFAIFYQITYIIILLLITCTLKKNIM